MTWERSERGHGLPGRAAFGVLAFAASLALGASAAARPTQPKMGEPIDGLSPAELQQFQNGKVDFSTVLTVPNGLGPIFNQNSCASCHNNPVGGSGSIFVTRFGFADKGFFDPLENLGGSLLQAQSISPECAESIPPFPISNIQANRITSTILGAGLIEAIPDEDIQFYADNPPPNVSGRVHMVVPAEGPATPRVGRFGWKAQVATVLTFSGDAALNEMGLTNRLFTQENAPNGDPDLLKQCDSVADPEDHPDGSGFEFIDRITHFQRFLAPPPQTPKSGMSGEAHFMAAQCGSCHVPSFTTPNDTNLEPALRNRTVKAYSDFLLHDMGSNADFIAQGAATEFEIRTPTLWGVRVRDPLWHDGRVTGGTFAERMTQVIALHNGFGSEAQASYALYNALSAQQKNELIAFLDSLGRAEFDADGDNHIDGDDFRSFADCFTGPGSAAGSISPDDPCAVHDIDQDGDVDLDDFAEFETVYEGVIGDCDNDTVNDLREILLGAADVNDNLIPDSCETPACPGDIDGDNDVDSTDLNVVLTDFGCTSSPCAGDADLDGDTDSTDLNIVLTAFGASCN